MYSPWPFSSNSCFFHRSRMARLLLDPRKKSTPVLNSLSMSHLRRWVSSCSSMQSVVVSTSARTMAATRRFKSELEANPSMRNGHGSLNSTTSASDTRTWYLAATSARIRSTLISPIRTNFFSSARKYPLSCSKPSCAASATPGRSFCSHSWSSGLSKAATTYALLGGGRRFTCAIQLRMKSLMAVEPKVTSKGPGAWSLRSSFLAG
mmetsp:Transcript_33430/g.64037  ORF Transcript_33430/g.64037 Transcript_33430/m.64037 type:complete len:207 (-) Transcript_33430:692-1312(-)